MTNPDNPSTARSERWMQTWPETMAKGPARFIARYVVGIVFFMALGSLATSAWRSDPHWRDGSYLLSQTALEVMVGIAFGLSQWTHANRRYADATGDPRARYWAERHYELPTAVWAFLVVALAVVVAFAAGRMAWASGQPMWWAVALLCAGVGAISLFALRQMRADARTR